MSDFITKAQARSLATCYSALNEALNSPVGFNRDSDIVAWGSALMAIQGETGVSLHNEGWLKSVVEVSEIAIQLTA